MHKSRKPLALVTGASAGIGAEYARQLAQRGHDLVLTARRRERLDRLAGELAERYGCHSQVVVADLALSTTPSVICREVAAAGRPVDILINNAGFAVPGYYNSAPWEDQQAFIRVMVTAVAELSYRLLPGMRERRHGGIINVASLAGIVAGSAGHTLYAAAKAFLIKFSESLAMENEDHGVRIQAFCPGFTYSEFHDVVGTRDIVSKMPDYMWMRAEHAVRVSLDAFANPRSPVVVVPGRINRLLAMLSRKLPYGAGYRLVKRRSGDFRRQE